MGQNGLASVQGGVSDAETGEQLLHATVAVFKNGKMIKGTVTDMEGLFLLDKIPAGSYVLSVRFLSYAASEQKISLAPGETLKIDVKIEPSPVALAGIEIIGQSELVYKKMTGTATKLVSQTIQSISPIGTQELLEHVPGVNGFSDDGMGNSRLSIGIRGLSPRRSSKVLILEDGIPIQPAVYIYPNMYYNPPAERIAEMEVIKSSASVKYGPQTMGGVVNYITSKPRESLGGLAKLTFGNNGFLSAYTEIGGFGNKKIRQEAQLLYKQGAGFRDNNDFKQANFTYKANIRISPSKSLYVKTNYNHELTQATYTGLTEYTFLTNPRFNPKKDDVFNVDRAALDIIYNKKISKNLSAQTKIYTNYFNRRWWRENDVFVKAFSDGSLGTTPMPWYEQGNLARVGDGKTNFGILRKFVTFGVEQSYNYSYKLLGKPANLETGGRGHYEKFFDVQVSGNSPTDRVGKLYTENADGTYKILGVSQNYTTRALSVYALNKWDISPKFSVSPGFRAEFFEQEKIDLLQGARYEDQTMLVLLPGFGFNWEKSDRINFFGGIHRGFTPPASSTLNLMNFGNSSKGFDLKSEKSWNTEIGVRGALPWASVEVAGFYVPIRDLVAAGRGTVFNNLGKVNSMGIENSLKMHLSEKIKFAPDLTATYTYMRTEIVKGTIKSAVTAGAEVSIAGKQLPYAPKHTLTVALSKDFDFGLSLRADMRYVSLAYTDFENIEKTYNRGDTGPVPGYHLFNASVFYDLNKRWQFFFVGKNLADKIYIGSRLHSNPGQPEAHLSSGIIPGARRQLNLGVKMSF